MQTTNRKQLFNLTDIIETEIYKSIYCMDQNNIQMRSLFSVYCYPDDQSKKNYLLIFLNSVYEIVSGFVQQSAVANENRPNIGAGQNCAVRKKSRPMGTRMSFLRMVPSPNSHPNTRSFIQYENGKQRSKHRPSLYLEYLGLEKERWYCI